MLFIFESLLMTGTSIQLFTYMCTACKYLHKQVIKKWIFPETSLKFHQHLTIENQKRIMETIQKVAVGLFAMQ